MLHSLDGLDSSYSLDSLVLFILASIDSIVIEGPATITTTLNRQLSLKNRLIESDTESYIFLR